MILLLALFLQDPLPVDDGYRGIWYINQPSRDEYKYKYSGGFATYPQQHLPIAIHSEEANKTFFVYGGTVQGNVLENSKRVKFETLVLTEFANKAK